MLKSELMDSLKFVGETLPVVIYCPISDSILPLTSVLHEAPKTFLLKGVVCNHFIPTFKRVVLAQPAKTNKAPKPVKITLSSNLQYGDFEHV